MFGFAENDIYSLGQVFTPFPASAATGQAFPHRFLPPFLPIVSGFPQRGRSGFEFKFISVTNILQVWSHPFSSSQIRYWLKLSRIFRVTNTSLKPPNDPSFPPWGK